MRDKDDLIQEWDQRLNAVFVGNVPETAEWTDVHEIANILDGIAGSFNHVFLPDSGGSDLGVCRVSEDGLLEWSTREDGLESHAYVSKPIKLTFWNPGKTTQEANFILEVAGLEPVDPSDSSTERSSEEVVEVSPGLFAPRYAWDDHQYQGETLPDSARLQIRTIAPSRFAIFGKGSMYNSYRGQKFDAYNAHHTNPVKFKNIVETMVAAQDELAKTDTQA